MIDDMMMRKLSPRTQNQYIRSVKNLARYLGHSPHTATAEDLRKYQLHLVDDGVSRITLNANQPIVVGTRISQCGLCDDRCM